MPFHLKTLLKNNSDPSKPAVSDQMKSRQILMLGVLGKQADEDMTFPHCRMGHAFSLTAQTLPQYAVISLFPFLVAHIICVSHGKLIHTISFIHFSG